ncbi:MAG: sensor histidine kinase [Bacteroidetes bacterium]|nr:sensor histidine kinase [Bacteroidota bacterium]
MNQIEQALMNILRNSIEAIDLTGTITISIEEEKGNHILLITDTGEGLSSEAKDQLFTPFFSTKPNGQGIGLTLVNEILSRHNFKFKLTCQPEFPTRFSIFL